MTHKMDVAIATWQPEGILRVEAMNLPRVPGVRYVVSWQLPGPDPVVPESLARRDDVFICYTNELGVGANRLNACNHCNAPIILNSDDDLVYTSAQIQSVIDTFEANPDVDLATFRYDGTDKHYPASRCDLAFPLPKGYHVACFEIAVRSHVLKQIAFDPRFGAPLFISGEDSKFMFDALKSKVHCTFFPITICTHNHLTTGERPMPKGVALAEGCLIRLQYPASWILRVPLKAWRNKKKGGNFYPTIYYLFKGALIKL